MNQFYFIYEFNLIAFSMSLCKSATNFSVNQTDGNKYYYSEDIEHLIKISLFFYELIYM